jgi:hypothetical protein
MPLLVNFAPGGQQGTEINWSGVFALGNFPRQGTEKHFPKHLYVPGPRQAAVTVPQRQPRPGPEPVQGRPDGHPAGKLGDSLGGLLTVGKPEVTQAGWSGKSFANHRASGTVRRVPGTESRRGPDLSVIGSSSFLRW